MKLDAQLGLNRPPKWQISNEGAIVLLLRVQFDVRENPGSGQPLNPPTQPRRLR